VGFGAIVHERLLEPWMLQGLFSGYTLLGVVYEYLSQEIKELAVEVSVVGDGFLRLLVMIRR
jgi:hypothetical protein